MTPRGTERRGGGRRATIAALGVLALLGAALLVYALTTQVGEPPQPPLRGAPAASDGGGATEPEATSDDQAAPVDPAPSAGPTASDGPAGAGEAETDAGTPSAASSADAPGDAPAAPLPAAEPTALRIPSIDVDAELFPIGLGADGELLAPRGEQADLPAWFDGSPTPGEDGPSVIEGHVTWGGDPSIFFELGALAPGDRIEVDREDGSTAIFEVYDAARYPKDAFPTVEVYGRTDGPELRLITCSGDLDAEGHHLDNTVVYARLVES